MDTKTIRSEVMTLGNCLFHARKKCRFSQEDVAEKLGVSRQTISKWETDETLPDIQQSKKMAVMYHMSLDELINFDIDLKEIEDIIEKSNEEASIKIDWTNAWAKKYPVLAQYQGQVNVAGYAYRLNVMLEELSREYNYDELDAFLVLKDILYQEWKRKKSKPQK